MASVKSIRPFYLLAKLESSYSGSTTLNSGSDGVDVAEFPEFTLGWVHNESRPLPVGSGGSQKRQGASGPTIEGTVTIEGKGLGSAYSAVANTVPSLHAFLLASGLSGSLTAGSWSFAPHTLDVTVKTPSSIALEAYTKGEKTTVRGAYCDLSWTLDGPETPKFNFALQGLRSLPTATAAPTHILPATGTMPPKAVGVALSIGGVSTFKLRSANVELGREIVVAPDVAAAGGVAGMRAAGRNPRFSVTVEETLLSTFDPYAGHAAGTSYAITLTVGSVANNRYTWSFPQAQIMNVEPVAGDGNAALWNIEFEVPVSANGNDDDFSLTFF